MWHGLLLSQIMKLYLLIDKSHLSYSKPTGGTQLGHEGCPQCDNPTGGYDTTKNDLLSYEGPETAISYLLPALTNVCPLSVSQFAKDLSSTARAQVNLLALQSAKQECNRVVKLVKQR